MQRPELTLDHAALLVRRLDESARAFERLGFTLSPRSVHEGQLEPGGRTVVWGTASRCIMLDVGYLELIAVSSETEYSRGIAQRAARREGIHLVAFGTSDLAGIYRRLADRLPGIEPPRFLVREWPFGTQTRTAAFRVAHLDSRAWPDADLALVEHHTPDLLWQPDWVRHANGALALAFVTIAATDARQSRQRFARLLGNATGPAFKLQHGRVTVTDLVSLVRRYPGIATVDAPFPAALGIRVADLGKVQAHLLAHRVPYQRSPNGSLWVEPAHAGGTIIEFLVETDAEAPPSSVEDARRRVAAG